MNENYPLIEEDNAPDTYVKQSIIDGYGLFASKDFNEGELVIDYWVFPQNWHQIKYEDLNEDQIRLWISKNLYVVLDSETCMTSKKISKFSYINHSRDANCFWDIENKKIFTQKNIKKDEELFIDYRLEPRPNQVKFPEWI